MIKEPIALLCVVVLLAFLYKCHDPRYVTVEQGVLQGKYWSTHSGRKFVGYTAIPYAKPPIGDLRFMPPVPLKSWTGILDASKVHAVCPQLSIYSTYKFIGNEDCLYLNIYVPILPPSESFLLPVMFYIHGGSFLAGSGRSDWLGPEILLDKNVILVTINYRLGALGFLSTGDNIVPGNNGLKDQNLALRWIKSNIPYFGGHPNKITVFGHSAGAACAHYHIISPSSASLVNGVILQSGVALAFYAINPPATAVENSRRLGTYLNCPLSSSSVLINCLQKAKVSDIVNAQMRFIGLDKDSLIPFRPVIEHHHSTAFLYEDPLTIIKERRAAEVPIIAGILENDGAFKSAALFKYSDLLRIFNKEHVTLIKTNLNFSTPLDASAVNMLPKYYFKFKTVDTTMVKALTDFYTDAIFLSGLDRTVQLHVTHSSRPVYQYLFSYRGSESYVKFFGNKSNQAFVPCHSDELLHLFTLGENFPYYKQTTADRKISDLMITLWSNFALHGNPTPEPTKFLNTWNPVRKDDQVEYYHIVDGDNATTQNGLYTDRRKLWRNLYT